MQKVENLGLMLNKVANVYDSTKKIRLDDNFVLTVEI